MLWWAVYYIIFVGINILGIEITMRFTVIITVAALAVLAFFFVAVLFSGKFDASLLTNIPPDEGQSSFLPHGIAGIFPALPFAIWFYLAIEELPLAAEESHDPEARHPARDDLGPHHADVLRHRHPLPEHRESVAAPRRSGHRRRRSSTGSRRSSVRVSGRRCSACSR